MSIFRRKPSPPAPAFKVVKVEHECKLPHPTRSLVGSVIALDECGHRWVCYDNWAGGPDWLPDQTNGGTL